MKLQSVWTWLKGLLGTPNREPQEYSSYQGRYILLHSYYILGVPCLGFPIKSFYWLSRYWGFGFVEMSVSTFCFGGADPHF